jgi:hypothetical protein
LKKYLNCQVDISQDSSNSTESGYEIIELNGTDEIMFGEEESFEDEPDENDNENIDGCGIEIMIIQSDTLFVLRKLD